MGRMLATPLLYDLALVTSLYFKNDSVVVCGTFYESKKLKMDFFYFLLL